MFFFYFQSPDLLLPYLDTFVLFMGNGMLVVTINSHLKEEISDVDNNDVWTALIILEVISTILTPIIGFVRN